MSNIDWEGSAERDESRAERRATMARALARGGMEGTQIISFETAEKVLTPKRREIIDTLRAENIDSVRGLARAVDRDKGQVSRDLSVLAEYGVVQFEERGRAKRPYLTQEHIIVEPL